VALGALFCAAQPARATTYKVGPTRPFPNLQAVADLLDPGDIVEVDGNVTYPGGVVFEQPGTKTQPITIRGLRVAGKRPIVSGGTNTVTFATPDPDVPQNGASHYIFEGFELTAGSFRCLYHQADDLTVRDVLVHDCPAHGILGGEQGSGSCLLERVEVHHCGAGTSQHQIYMATDEVHHAGSVFRMQYCYVHDATGGNNVKSRAERNEIRYNWIEGATFHELELIGPDPGGAPEGWTEGLVREDSDVVGNVLWQRNTFYVVRAGGDGTGQSNGRYRFVNNTILTGSSAVFRLFDGLQSIEMHGNVFYRPSGGVVDVVRQVEADWTNGEQIAGSSNWVLLGATHVPSQWTGTLSGTQPGFQNVATNDLRLTPGSPLVNAANPNPVTPAAFPFPLPGFPPEGHPPLHTVDAVPMGRAFDCDLDIGAYEYPPTPLTVWPLKFENKSKLTWLAATASAYDVVRGDLTLLLATSGNFTSAVLGCLENNGTDTIASDATVPASGQGYFYLVRSSPGGTYDSFCASQVASRDAGIQASGLACP
jgi:hypothetical protein